MVEFDPVPRFTWRDWLALGFAVLVFLAAMVSLAVLVLLAGAVLP